MLLGVSPAVNACQKLSQSLQLCVQERDIVVIRRPLPDIYVSTYDNVDRY